MTKNRFPVLILNDDGTQFTSADGKLRAKKYIQSFECEWNGAHTYLPHIPVVALINANLEQLAHDVLVCPPDVNVENIFAIVYKLAFTFTNEAKETYGLFMIGYYDLYKQNQTFSIARKSRIESREPSPSFLAHFRAIAIKENAVHLIVPKGTHAGSFAYTWAGAQDEVFARLDDSNGRKGFVEPGTGHVLTMVAHRPSVHNYAAPVFFKPSHDEIAAQFADVLGDDEEDDFYVCTELIDERMEIVSERHLAVTRVYKRVGDIQ